MSRLFFLPASVPVILPTSSFATLLCHPSPVQPTQHTSPEGTRAQIPLLTLPFIRYNILAYTSSRRAASRRLPSPIPAFISSFLPTAAPSMDQQSSSYPPSYHVSTRQAFDSQASSHHTRDYQRRRDERHAQRDAAYAGDVERRGTENPYWDPRGAPPNVGVQQPLYLSRAGDRPIASRTGSGSGSLPSSHLLSDAELGASPNVFALPSKEGGYPEGWTKEDEEAEREFMKRGMIDWNELKSWRFWIRKEWWCECC